MPKHVVYRYVKRVEGYVVRSLVVSYDAGSHNLFSDFFYKSVWRNILNKYHSATPEISSDKERGRKTYSQACIAWLCQRWELMPIQDATFKYLLLWGEAMLWSSLKCEGQMLPTLCEITRYTDTYTTIQTSPLRVTPSGTAKNCHCNQMVSYCVTVSRHVLLYEKGQLGHQKSVTVTRIVFNGQSSTRFAMTFGLAMTIGQNIIANWVETNFQMSSKFRNHLALTKHHHKAPNVIEKLQTS